MIAPALLEPLVDRALAEDLQGGDLTTQATIPADTVAQARVETREQLVVCGGQVFQTVCRRVDPTLRVELDVADGAEVPRDTHIWRLSGSARSILIAERTALNFAQRLSGIATTARRYVSALPERCPTRIADTRKTTPGLRQLERYAARCGGANNHRDCLGSAVLIKDNHIAVAGGIAEAIERARAYAPHTTRIECEVESLDGVREALQAGAEIILLDNFKPQELSEAVNLCRGRALVEASGGVTLERVRELGLAGVDVISVGALTHSVQAADLSLEITLDLESQ